MTTATPLIPRWLRQVAAAAAVVCLSLLSGCTGSAPPNPSGPAVSAGVSTIANDADLHFAETMPGHHDQAIEMSKSLLDKPAVSPELLDLARGVQAAHQTQLDSMSTWPSSWAVDPAASHTEATEESGPGHHGGEGGLMTENQMRDLDLAGTADAQQLYLDGMIRHHQGALAVAKDEAKNGKNPDAVTLAKAIIDSHPEAIAAMVALRARL